MTNRTRIFVDAHVFDHEFQGSRTFIREIYRIFITNQDFQFFFGAQNIENLKKEFPESDNVGYVKYNSGSSFKRLFFELPKILKKLNVDYAHFQYIVPPFKVCKYIVTTHDILFHDFPKEFSWKYRFTKHWLFKISAKMADVLTTVSDFSKKSIHKFFQIPLNKIHVVPNAVGDTFFLNYEAEKSKKRIEDHYKVRKYVLVVSRIEPRKNHISVLKTFCRLSLFKKGYSLVFIGKESITDKKLNKLIHDLPEEERKQLYMVENISEDDLIHFYKGAELSIYPSKAEGFGIPPLESAALLTPTLCSNISAMSDFSFFKDDLFDPFNLDELTVKTKDILNCGKSVEYLEKLKLEIKNKYSWDVSVGIFSELLMHEQK